MRPVPLLFLALLVLASVPAVPASSHPLEADAGLSVVAYNGAPAPVAGKAFGGTAPYGYAWSHAGSGARFASPAAAATTFDTAGLATGPVVLTLTVTDALGSTATDTVKVLVESALVLEQDVPITAGAPDELVTTAPVDRRLVNFAVPAGMARLDATLSWPEADYDLDLVVVGPGGASSGSAGETAANPERVSFTAPTGGSWQAQVKPFLSGPTTAHLSVRAFPGGGLPTAIAPPSRPYGTLDAQVLTAGATGGTAPYSFAWDADGDGWFETSGASVTLALGAGTHHVAFKATDAAGYEVGGASTLTVKSAEHVLRVACGNEPGALWAMEFAQSGGTCWVHGGHHTYTLAGKQATLRGFEGFAFAVEQQFAPSVPPASDPTSWVLHVETSEDGLTWTEVGTGRYAYAAQRQYVQLKLSGLAQDFRHIRIHAPLSASQGLSGYLDHSEGYLLVDDLMDAPAPALAAGARNLTCDADLMEDFFATHPCWFGGVDRYDAPSFWHTYVVGDGAKLDRVHGSFKLLPWRTDDWNQGNATTNATAVSARLMTSVDGSTWTERAVLPGTFGVDVAFDVPLDDVDARFVRLFPENHARFDQTAQFAPNHHPKGFFVDSRITVEGDLPS